LQVSCKPKAIESENTGAATEGVAFGKHVHWKKANVGVCWENPKPSARDSAVPFSVGQFMKDVEGLTKKGLKGSVIQLVGWNECAKTAKDMQNIRVFVYDDPVVDTTPHLAEIKRNMKDSATKNPLYKHSLDLGHYNEAGNPRLRRPVAELDSIPAGLVLSISLEKDVSEMTLKNGLKLASEPTKKFNRAFEMNAFIPNPRVIARMKL
jgi:hypothetical protein